MKPIKKNLFDVSQYQHKSSSDELFEVLFKASNCHVERIVSTGQSTPPGEWYDQEQDECVALLQGKAVLSFAECETMELLPGDYVLIPARCRHRVEKTSANPPCVWVALHGNFTVDDAN